MKTTTGLPNETLPKPRSNPLTPLHEFVITVITYAKFVGLDGKLQIIPVRTVVKG